MQQEDTDSFLFQCNIVQVNDSDQKQRIVALSDKKFKGRIMRINEGVVTKSWNVDEIKSISIDSVKINFNLRKLS
jgi:hypothetical protein